MSSLQSPSDTSACNGLVCGLDDRSNAPITLLAALQHLLAIVVPIVTPGLLIYQALGVSPRDTSLTVSTSLVTSGIATLVQYKYFGPFDAGLLIVQGTSFDFVGPLVVGGVLMVRQDTPMESVMAAIFGMVIADSFAGTGISRILPFVKRLVTPLVTGIVVLMIGLALIKVGLISTGGGLSAISNGIFAGGKNLLPSGVVLGIIVVLNHIPVVWMRSCATVIAPAVDCTLAGYLDRLDFTGMHRAELFQIPTPLHFGPDLSWPLFIPILVIYLVTPLEAIDDVTATNKVSEQLTRSLLWAQRIKSGVLANGTNSFLIGISNTFPSSVFAQDSGMIQLTDVASHYVGLRVAAMLVLLGLFPSVAGVIQAVPEPVLGGTAMVMFGTVVASGINILADTQLDRRALLIITVSLALGLGTSQVSGFLAHMPTALRGVLGSGVATGGICTLLLNWFLLESPVRKAAH